MSIKEVTHYQIKEVTYYQAVCDAEGCSCTTGKHADEHSAWATPDVALDDAQDGDWTKDGDALYCPCHSLLWCEDECDAPRMTAKERFDGQTRCDVCEARRMQTPLNLPDGWHVCWFPTNEVLAWTEQDMRTYGDPGDFSQAQAWCLRQIMDSWIDKGV